MEPILSDSFTAALRVLRHSFRTCLNICGTEKESKELTFAILTEKTLAACRAPEEKHMQFDCVIQTV